MLPESFINWITPYMPWLDVLWIPVALLIARKGQKIKAGAFVLVCMVSLRLQAEIIKSTGHPNGFTGFFESDIFYRGMSVYSFFILAFLGLSYISPGTRGVIYVAASLSIFFMAFISSFLIMLA